MQNKFKVINDSGDHRYFTMVPNYIVNHSTVYEQAIYLYMKRIAGETSTCWTSNQEIGKKLQCSRNTVAKYRNKLIKRGWIEIVGNKKVGQTSQTVPEYKIIDLWELNNKFYAEKHKVSNNDILDKVSTIDEKVSTGDGKVSLGVRKEEPMKKNPEEEIVASDTPFSLKEEIKKLEDSPRRDLNIVALYFEHRKPDLQNRQQYQTALKRHLKPAGVLKDFTDTQILKALDSAKKEYKDIYTIETLEKIITK